MLVRVSTVPTYTVYTLCTVSKRTGHGRQKQEEREGGRESVHGEGVRGRKMMEEGEGGRACGRERVKGVREGVRE